MSEGSRNVSDAVHSCLDREMHPSLLDSADRDRLRGFEEVLERVRADLRGAPLPDLREGIMHRIHAESAAPGRLDALRKLVARGAHWLWGARRLQLAFRPAYGAAFALLLLLAVHLSNRSTPVEDSPPPPVVYVEFRLEAPGAERVALASSFTEWEPSIPLAERSPGVWAALVPLRPGVHDYTFVIDGEEWVVDPDAPQVEDDFGGRNNRIPVPDPSAST